MKSLAFTACALFIIPLFSFAIVARPPSDDVPGEGDGIYCPSLSQTLRRGMKDITTNPTGQVSELQNFLADYFDLNEQDVVSGFFGKNTQRYLTQFQQAQGLPAFGIAGTLTRVKIAEVCKGGTVQPTCNNYPKPYCGPNQRVEESEPDSRGCPRVARCVDIVVSGAPSCVLQADRAQYNLNDTITFSWTSANATYAYFVPDTSGKDNLQVPGDKLLAQGTQLIRATVYGNPYVTLKVASADGRTATCTKTVSVTNVNNSPLTVTASLADPKGLGRESFPFGDQLVIKWDVSQPSDVETGGWGIYGSSQTGIELRPVNNTTAASTRIVRVAESGTFPHTFTWNITREGLFGDRVAPGRYYVYVNVPSKKQGGYVAGVAGPISIGETTSTNSITVTAPNGGEQWSTGVLNTVTWAPYQYNPDINPARDVTAYLERANGSGGFDVVGKIEETGKASIHWIAGELNSSTTGSANYAGPGQYYVRVVNNITGATDRSDAPFTLLARPVDLKVNGSDGPVAISDPYQKATISWRSSPGQSVYTCQLSGLTNQPWDSVMGSDGSLSSGILFYGTSASVGIQCITRNSAGIETQVHDYVNVTTSTFPQSSVRITSPNGGEALPLEQPTTITWMAQGLSNYSLALYRNDQWQDWIIKENAVPTFSTPTEQSFQFNPASMSAAPGFPAYGASYKIYITGKKVDGSGYVDDKSDAPFSFSTSSAAKKLTITQPGAGEYKLGSLVPIQWTLGGFVNDNYTQIKLRLQTYSTSGQYDDVAELGMLNAFALSYPQYITADTKGCQSLGAAYCTKTVGAYLTEGKNKFIITGEIYNNGVFAGVREFSSPFTLAQSQVTFSGTGPNVMPTWTQRNFTHYNGKQYCFGAQFIAQSPKYPGAWLGAERCNDATADQYKLYMSDSENGTYYQIADTAGHGQDHCELVNPSFTIPNEDDIKSGGCATCDVQNMSDPQDEPVFARANFGQPFKLQKSVFWSDLSSQIYKCGVTIPTGTVSQSISGASAGGVSNQILFSPMNSIWTVAPMRQFGF